MVVAVFQYFVAVDVLDVEMGVESEPFFILPLIEESFFVDIFVERVELLVDILKQFINSLLPKVIIVIA